MSEPLTEQELAAIREAHARHIPGDGDAWEWAGEAVPRLLAEVERLRTEHRQLTQACAARWRGLTWLLWEHGGELQVSERTMRDCPDNVALTEVEYLGGSPPLKSPGRTYYLTPRPGDGKRAIEAAVRAERRAPIDPTTP